MKNFFYTYGTILIMALMLAVAAMLNAGMDTIAHHYKVSVFKEWSFPSDDFWVNDWTKKYEKDEQGNLIVERTDTLISNGDTTTVNYYARKKFLFFNAHPAMNDGWHLLKVLMIEVLILLIICYYVIRRNLSLKDGKTWIKILVIQVLLALAWNVTFNLFYDTVFRLV